MTRQQKVDVRLRSERDPDAAALLPNQQAVFLDPAVVENEALRNGLAAVHLDAGATGANIDDVAAIGGELFRAPATSILTVANISGAAP